MGVRCEYIVSVSLSWAVLENEADCTAVFQLHAHQSSLGTAFSKLPGVFGLESRNDP